MECARRAIAAASTQPIRMFQSLFLWNALVEERRRSENDQLAEFQSLFLWNALVERFFSIIYFSPKGCVPFTRFVFNYNSVSF